MHEKLQDLRASIRTLSYLLERMFPRFREQLGTALDLIVEFSTLGEYRLDAHGAPVAAGAPAEPPGHAPQLGGAGPRAARAADRRTVAEGPAGNLPVAAPAARRPPAGDCRKLAAATPCAEPPAPHRPPRAGAAVAREQLCFGL